MDKQNNKCDLDRKEKFEEIFTTYFQRLYLYARKLLNSDCLAEDAVEEVYYNLWKTQLDLTKVEKVETYLYVSVKNQVIRMLSKDESVFISLNINNEIMTVEQTNPEDILLGKELVAMIDREILKLPEQCQIIFKMSSVKQMEHQEIADEMGISIDCVRSQIYKALSKIRKGISKWKDLEVYESQAAFY